jgi:hypothetical protein
MMMVSGDYAARSIIMWKYVVFSRIGRQYAIASAAARLHISASPHLCPAFGIGLI